MTKRCNWCIRNEDLIDYHDHIWGQKRDTDEQLFEALTYEVFQSGLSWEIVYNKRHGFREAFCHFQLEKVAQLDEATIEALRENPAIIRHRMKIAATVHNARAILAIQQQYGSFKAYLEQLTPQDYTTFRKQFKFVGPTTLESFLMACGYIEAIHEAHCFLAK